MTNLLSHKRSRIENADMGYTVRINGRIAAAFRKVEWAEDFVHSLKKDYPSSTVELTDRFDRLRCSLPVESSVAAPGC